MNIIVLDLEYNQPSQNIIQIGAVVLNTKSGAMDKSYNKFLALPKGEVLDPFIIKLCGITEEMLSLASPAAEVLADFWQWVDDQQVGGKVWAWGSDTYDLKEQTFKAGVWKYRKVKNLDIKMLAQLYFDVSSKPAKGGLRTSLEKLGLTFEGRQHNAYDDAYNTGRVLYRICQDMDKVAKVRKIIEGN